MPVTAVDDSFSTFKVSLFLVHCSSIAVRLVDSRISEYAPFALESGKTSRLRQALLKRDWRKEALLIKDLTDLCSSF